MHDGMPYDPIQGSRSLVLESHSRGVDCQSRMRLIFFVHHRTPDRRELFNASIF